MSLRIVLGLSAMLAAGVWFAGCSKPADKPAPAATVSTSVSDGWWCNEHGVPEEVCALCSTKVAANFKAKGDWCKEHDRPESQCFICHPEKEAEFAAQYEAKYGKKPPKPETESKGEENEAKS